MTVQIWSAWLQIIGTIVLIGSITFTVTAVRERVLKALHQWRQDATVWATPGRAYSRMPTGDPALDAINSRLDELGGQIEDLGTAVDGRISDLDQRITAAASITARDVAAPLIGSLSIVVGLFLSLF